MSDGGAEDLTGSKVPRWESELWSFLCKGDGERCPLYDRCLIRRECSWCVSEHITEINQLLENRQFNIAKYDFIKTESKRLGKPFRLVEMLAQKYLRKGKVHGPPVPVELISLFDTERNIEIHSIPLKAYHGAIWRLKDRWIIQLKSGDILTMKRYILFHEAFHVLAHIQGVPVFRKIGANQGSFNELLADFYAIFVLMPKKAVKEKWAEVNDLKQMAENFQVTELSMWIRLKTMGLI